MGNRCPLCFAKFAEPTGFRSWFEVGDQSPGIRVRIRRDRGQDYGTYDFATQYAIRFAQLSSLRHLTPEEYEDRVGELIREVEDKFETKRDGNPVAGVEKVLSQNPIEPPTRVTKRSPRPLFHVASKEERKDFLAGFLAFQAQYRIASDTLLRGDLKAATWFPEDSYPPALPFVGPAPPKRPPWPPSRPIRQLDSGTVERGEIPVVEIASAFEPRARGQPP